MYSYLVPLCQSSLQIKLYTQWQTNILNTYAITVNRVVVSCTAADRAWDVYYLYEGFI